MNNSKRDGGFVPWLIAAGLLVAAILYPQLVVAAEQKIALVIGNSAYPTSRLRNPVNDAKAMAEKLRALGFEVILRTDSNLRDMTRAFSQFGQQLTPGSVSLFYYAGHGVQVRGKNYLVPVDAEIENEASVITESVDVDQLLHQLAPARLSMVILDACRNNPFERRFRGAASGGLAQIDAPTGTLLAYATAPGKVASDGNGSNGLYTEALLTVLDAPGLKVEDVFKQVRINVVKASDGLQTPWESSSLTGEFFFRPGTQPEIENAQLRQAEKERTELRKEMEKLRAEMVTLKDTNTQIALSSPSASANQRASYKAEWSQRIALLEKLRGQLTFSKAIAVLLDIASAEELNILLAFEGRMKARSWHAALAMGVDNSGIIVWGGGYQLRNPQFAAETALEFCTKATGDGCRVVAANSDLQEKTLIDVANKLGARSVAATRAAFLESLRKNPQESVVGGGGTFQSYLAQGMGYSSVR